MGARDAWLISELADEGAGDRDACIDPVPSLEVAEGPKRPSDDTAGSCNSLCHPAFAWNAFA